MKKLKLLLAACALLFGSAAMWAQTDVTSTYITNASFESDGAINASNGALTMTGWTQSDPTSSFNNTGCYDASTTIPTQGTVTVTPSDGNYFLYFRKGWAQNTYTFTSAGSTLPSGSYTLSVDYKMVEGYDNTQNNKSSVTISAKNGETVLGSGTGSTKTNVSGGNAYTYLNTAAWTTVSTSFSLDEETNVSFVIGLQAGGQRRTDFVIDNVRLLYSNVIRPTAVTLPSQLELDFLGTATLTPTFTPADANTDTDITWTSDNETVATVLDGVVTAVGIGSANITATTANGKTSVCAVTVSDVAEAAAPSFYSEIAEGDFYLVNAATGKFLGTKKEGWGTQAALAIHGIPFTVTLNDGKYTLDSHTYNRATDHFFNGSWVDQPSTDLYINALGNGKYSISTADGSAFVIYNPTTDIVANTAASASSVLAQWYFVSKANLESALANATSANPMDATFYIQDPDFSRNHILQLVQNGQTTKNPGNETYLWKYTATNYHFKGGENGNMCAETYQNGGGKIYQQLTNIPNGKYIVKAQAFHNGSGVTSLYANSARTDVAVLNANGEGTAASMSGASSAFSAGQYQNELEDVFVTDGTLEIGIENAASNWACFDNFELYYCGPTVGGKAEALPETEMTAGKWYYFDIAVEGMYNLTATTLDDIVYTTDANVLIENESSVTTTFEKAENATLAAGRYYVKSASAQAFTVTAGSYAYNLGAATLSNANGSYTQSQTFTVTFSAAASNDPDAVTAFVPGSVATVNGTEVALTAVEGGFSLNLGTITAATDYAIVIPAGVYGYADESMNEAISVTLHTPLLLDGVYSFYNAANKVFLGRGAAWGTEAVADKYGIPFTLTTDATGVSTIEFVDWKGVYLFSVDKGKAASVYTDNASTGWTLHAADGGYKLKDANGDVYARIDDGGYGLYVHTVEGIDNATVWAVKTVAERNEIISAYPADNINTVIDAAGIETTAADFATHLDENYNAIDATNLIGTANFAGSVGDWTWSQVRGQDNQPAYGDGFAELWNATGAYTQTIAAANLPAGIYKVTVQGFERRCANGNATTLYEAGYNNVSTYLSANGEQVRFTDWNDVEGKPTNTGSAVTAFNNGEAVNELFVYLDGATDLTLTVRKPNYMWDCWVIFNNFTLTRYEQSEATLAVSDAKYGTFVAPFDVTVPTGVTAYTVSGAEGNKLTLSPVETTIAANTPVVLYSETATNQTVKGKAVAGTPVSGLLTGVYEATLAPVGSYVLQKNDNKVGFYQVAEGGQPTIKANRAYLTAPANNARVAFFFDDETTGINAINALIGGNAEIFDANGRAQQRLVKGMNIIRTKDGKVQKVMVK